MKKIRPAGWWPDALLVALFVALTGALAAGAFLGWDLAVRNWVDARQPTLLHRAARAGNLLGQGGYLAEILLVFALFLAWRRRSVRPLFPVGAGFGLNFVVVTVLKHWLDRAPPHAFSLAHPERLGSGGVSYPSGHLVNAIVWYGVLALLCSRWLPEWARRTIQVAPAAILCVTTVYLGFHWLTDTVAGLLLGLVLDRVMRRIDWDALPLGRRLAATGWTGPALDPARLPTPASARAG